MKSIPKKKQMEQSKPPVIALDVMSSISSELQTKGPLVAEPIQKSRSFALGDRQTEIVLNHNKDEVFVGRLRIDNTMPNTLNMWIVADNLRKGAATNAIQIAEYLVEKELVGVS